MDDFGNLRNCIVEGDASAMGSARLVRRKALAGSLLLEGAVVGLLLLCPLMAPGVLPHQESITPLPPYSPRLVQVNPQAPRPLASEHPGPQVTELMAASHPTGLQPTPGPSGELATPELQVGVGLEVPDIPGATNRGAPVSVARPEVSRGPVRMSGGVMEAKLIRRVEPEYPMVARTLHISGTVELRAIIATDGRVRELEVLSGNPILARAVCDAVQQWRYEPTRLNGEPVEVETHITVDFRMR